MWSTRSPSPPTPSRAADCGCGWPRPASCRARAVTLSIRPHLIVLVEPPSAAPGRNVLGGTVRRASFLGDAIDYEVEIAG